MKSTNNDQQTLLRCIGFTKSEEELIEKACRPDGVRIPRPKFYHDAIVKAAKEAQERTNG